MVGCHFFHRLIVWMPETVSSPRIERTMISGFLHGVEYIIVFNDVSAPGSFAYIDSGTRSIVNTVVRNGDRLTHGQFNSGDLFFKQTDFVDQIIYNQAIGRIIVPFRTFLPIQLIERYKLTVFETGRTYTLRISYKNRSHWLLYS